MTAFFFWTLVVGFLVATTSAIACHVFKEMSWHEMEELCLRKQRPELFSKIFDLREPMEVGASVLQMIALAFAIPAGAAWLAGANGMVAMSWQRFIMSSVLMAFFLVSSQTWVPWAVAQIAAPQFLYRTWRWWWTVSIISYPFLVGEKIVSIMFARASGQPEEEDDEEEAVEDEILSLASEAHREGNMDPDTREMIEGIMGLDDDDLTKVMTPRSAVDALDIDTQWEEMLSFVVDSGRTRIPVHDGQIDNILGILYAKDLLRESLKKQGRRRPLKKLLRKPVTMPETTQLNAMLREFLKIRVHMAIVTDEFGGFAGVVTIEDLLEEIVGEIVDETDDEEKEQIQLLAKNIAEVDGATPIDRINETLGVQLSEEEDVATIGGLIMRELKDIPRIGHELQIGNVKLEVQEANRRAIRRVRLEVIVPDGE